MGTGSGIKRRWRRLFGTGRSSEAHGNPMARPTWSVVVEIIYQAALLRSPDAEGISIYTAELSSGSRLPTDVLATVRNSAEGRTVSANLTANALIPALYQGLTSSDPSDEEMARWRQRLLDGATQAEVVRELAATPKVRRAQLNRAIEQQGVGALFLAEFRRRGTIGG